MREKDIDHKDHQNYDAAVHITSERVLDLLSDIPEAMGTFTYLKIMHSIIDSYLDRNLDARTRIEKAWYGA